MKVIELSPLRETKDLIHKFVYLESSGDAYSFRVIPRIFPAIFFVGSENGELEISIGDATFILHKENVYFAGLGFYPSVMHFRGTFKTWVVMLKPQACRFIFDAAPHYFLNNIVLANNADPLNFLNEEIWSEQREISYSKFLIDHFLLKIFGNCHFPLFLLKALEEIHSTRGLSPVRIISQKSFSSNRNLLREFLSHTGVNPKKYSTMVRFSCLMNELMLSPKKIETLAFAYNYYDVSHLNKDAKSFLGTTLKGSCEFAKGLNDLLL